MGKAGEPMNPENNRKAMAYFATIGVTDGAEIGLVGKGKK